MRKIIKFIKFLVISVILLVIIFSSITIYQGYKMYKAKSASINLEEKINTIKSDESYVSYNEIPKDFINAIVAVEDHRFFVHNGIDIISIGRAIITDIKEMSLVEGGSTITQQLAKNLYYTQEKKFSRKVAEVFTAFDLEKKLKKEEILELYLNIVYYGDGHYGVQDASKGYFSKKVKDLSLYEITLLAGLPNAPSAYALSSDKELAYKRQDMVIDAMVKYNYITNEKATEIKNMRYEYEIQN